MNTPRRPAQSSRLGSWLLGIGSALDISGLLGPRMTQGSIADDWRAIGDDPHVVMGDVDAALTDTMAESSEADTTSDAKS